jgi:hypothetical protein
MMLPFINANTPDDPVKIEQLRKAINSVLDVISDRNGQTQFNVINQP